MQSKNRRNKNLFIGFVAGIYTFVVFFAGFLHTHSYTFDVGHKVKVEKAFQPNVNDCLSCHLMGDYYYNNSLDFSVQFFDIKLFADQIFFHQQDLFLQAVSYSSLRGPPAIA